MTHREDLFGRVDGRLVVGGVPVTDLAGSFGTPIYVFDAARVEAALARLVTGIGYRPLRVLYSVKAHASVAILELLGRLGAGADCGSPGDLAFACAAGFSPPDVSYCGHGLSDAELDHVARSEVPFVAGSLRQLEGYLRRRPGADVAVRVNCGIEAGFHPSLRAGASGAKFGVPRVRMGDVVALAEELGARLVGLHGHLGSDILRAEPYIDLLEALVELAADLGLDPDFIDLGGGFGVPFTDDEGQLDVAGLGAELEARLVRYNRSRRRPVELRIEPGAYLVREAGYLLAGVTEVVAAVGGQRVISVDSSVNHLPGALYYEAAHPVRTTASGAEQTCSIAGNLMLAGDVLRREVVLPTPVPGELVIFGLCGAYSATRASTFNQRPRPAEVLVEGGVARLIRRAETVPDLLKDQVPAPRE